MAFLQSISADDIKRIEVITNPPARYEAEGDGGLINIIYKKGRGDHWNAELRSLYRYDTHSYCRTGGHFSYRKNKLALALNLNGVFGSLGGFDIARTYLKQIWAETTDQDCRTRHLSGRLAVDYKPTEKTSLGLQYFGRVGKAISRTKDVMAIYNRPRDLDAQIKTHDRSETGRNNQALNLHYLFKPDSTGKAYATDLDYFNYYHELNARFESQYYQPDGHAAQTILKADNSGEQRIENYSAKVDVTQPTKWLVLAYGAKLSFTQSDSAIAFFDTGSGRRVPNPAQSDRFNYSENTWALYLSASKKLNERWQGKWGLRVKNTQTKGVSKTSDQTRTNRYTKLFPSLYLAYTSNSTNVFALSYGKCIERPTYHMLDPTCWYFSDTSYVEGNPSLRPSFTANFILSYLEKELTSSLHLYTTRDGFAQVPSFNAETGQQIYKRENFYTNRVYSLEERFHFKPCPWWQSQGALHLNYVECDFDPDKVVTSKKTGPFVYNQYQ